MELKKKDELSDKQLEGVVGGVTRREIAADPTMRKRADNKLKGVGPPEKPEMDDYTPDPVSKRK